MAQFIEVATTVELADQQAKLIEVEGQKIALFRVDSGFYALSDTAPIEGDVVGRDSRGTPEVTCPWHGAKFDVRTGAVLGRPPGRPSKPSR